MKKLDQFILKSFIGPFFAILLVVVYAVKYIMGGLLHASGELSERYNLPVYGEYASSRSRRSGKGLDKLLEKWEFKHALTDVNAVDSGVCVLLDERFAGKSVLLTGTVPEARLEALADRLRKKLGGVCEVAVRGDLPVNAEAIAAVKAVDAVILVEAKHVSKHVNIERAAEQLSISDADVAGCIVL